MAPFPSCPWLGPEAAPTILGRAGTLLWDHAVPFHWEYHPWMVAVGS